MDYLEKNKDITQLSNYKTPARAEYYYELQDEKNVDKIYEIFIWAKKEWYPVLVISGGTNMLFAFDEYKGVVIKNSLAWWTYNEDTQILHTFWSELIWDIAYDLENTYRQDLWHRFIWLPGSIAGAIYWNAGCFGLETENNFVSCKVLDLETGQEKIIVKSEMDFSYRNSKIKQEKRYFIISAIFDLSEKIEKYHSDVDNIDFRENKQPKGNSCGSFFKNPKVDRDHFFKKFPEYYNENMKAISAGFLLEKAGLKWYHIGGAYFSEKHANFLMHDWQGNYKDMLDLISYAQETVQNKFGIMLENEVQIIR